MYGLTDHLLHLVSQNAQITYYIPSHNVQMHRSLIASCFTKYIDHLLHFVHWLTDHLLRVSNVHEPLITSCLITCIDLQITYYVFFHKVRELSDQLLRPGSQRAWSHRSLITSCFTEYTDHSLRRFTTCTDSWIVYYVLFHSIHRPLIISCLKMCTDSLIVYASPKVICGCSLA